MQTIRCSMLPTYIDCARMAAVNQFRELISDAGYNIPSFKKNTIYTILGKVNHKATEYMITSKIKNKKINENTIIDYSFEQLFSEVKKTETIEYENIIPNYSHAELQIKRFVSIYNQDVLPKLQYPENANPAEHIELYLKAKKGEYTISGHIDTLTTQSVVDTKTGKILKTFHTQIGGYDLLTIANNIIKPKYNIIVHIPRTHIDKQYPGTKFEVLDVDFCSREALSVINRIIYDLDNFKKNGDCRCFTANPQSMLCNKKYCRAYGTNFCEYFK